MLIPSLTELHAKLPLIDRCKQMEEYLDDSARGPTGDLESSKGLLPSCTSWSRLFDSFLSSPASLPAAG